MKKTLWTMAAALALTGCSQDNLLNVENTPVQEQNAVAFGTYVGDNAQSRATVVTTETLGGQGFGVNAYYTGQELFSAGTEYSGNEIFMTNTKVTFNPDKGENGAWTYSPLKYWPNNDGDKVSFFAYGPYSKDEGDNNITQNGTDLKFTVPSDVKQQVDLIYNTNYVGTVNQEKPAVESKIMFNFSHALSRISFTVEAAVDEVPGDNKNNLLDGNTRINVKKVALVGADGYDESNVTGPFYTEGTLSLLEPEEGVSPWTIEEGINTQGFVFDATNFYHTVEDNGEDVLQLTRFNASEPQRLLNDSSYLMIIPQTTSFKIYIEYDVISEGNDNDANGDYDSSTISNKITKEIAQPIDFEIGRAYNFNLVLGMTSVKFESKVTEWGEEIDGGTTWLPENSEANISQNEEGVFEIWNEKQLARMRTLVNSGESLPTEGRSNATTYAEASYILMDNIDLSAYENWEPIGKTYEAPFKGTFDGNGKSITGVTITITDTEYEAMKYGNKCNIGLFNHTEYATIEGLSVNGHITTSTTDLISFLYVGGIVGSGTGSSIYDCHFSGTLTNHMRSATIGGVAGSASDVIACTATNVTLVNDASSVTCGGVVGFVMNKVVACYAYNNDYTQASGLSVWGGIIGDAYNSTNNVVNACYNFDVVSSNIATYVGAVLGQARDLSGQYMANCYSIEMTDVTNFVGNTDESDADPLDCGFVATDGDWTAARDAMNNALIELEEADYRDPSYYDLKFKFPETAGACPLVLENGLAEYTAPAMSGRGTAESPYLIYTAEQLAEVRDNINNDANAPEWGDTDWNEAHYKLMKDIDLSSVCNEGIGSWTPIGMENNNFEGNFNGNNCTVSNLYFYNENSRLEDGAGLFGKIDAYSSNMPEIYDLNVEGNITAYGFAGGIVGYLYTGIIRNCTFRGSVTGSYQYSSCGGIVGNISHVKENHVINCHNLGGTVSGQSYVGGVIGQSYHGNAIGCSNMSTVSGTGSSIGGVVGYSNWDSGAYFAGCWNGGSVVGNDRVGGILGGSNYSAKFIGCYNFGSIQGNSNEVGGLCGDSNSSTSNYVYGTVIIGCYNTGDVSSNKAFVDEDKWRVLKGNYFGISEAVQTGDGMSKVDGETIQWNIVNDETVNNALYYMNKVISEYIDDTDDVNLYYKAHDPVDVKYLNSWRFIVNTGDDKDKRPLIHAQNNEILTFTSISE